MRNVGSAAFALRHGFRSRDGFHHVLNPKCINISVTPSYKIAYSDNSNIIEN